MPLSTAKKKEVPRIVISKYDKFL